MRWIKLLLETRAVFSAVWAARAALPEAPLPVGRRVPRGARARESARARADEDDETADAADAGGDDDDDDDRAGAPQEDWSKASAEEVFAEFDTDASGYISYDEFQVRARGGVVRPRGSRRSRRFARDLARALSRRVEDLPVRAPTAAPSLVSRSARHRPRPRSATARAARFRSSASNVERQELSTRTEARGRG